MRIGNTPKPCVVPKANELACEEVPLRPRFVLGFDRIMAPSSVSRANYTITSGTSGNLAFARVRVDPVERTVVFVLDQALLPNVEYRLVVKAAERASERLQAYDGTPFEGETVLRFKTRTAPGDDETEVDPLPEGFASRADVACAAISTLAGNCTGARCHGNTELNTPPALGLSLVHYRAIEQTAIRKAAVEVQLAAEPGGVGRATTDFPYGLPLIEPTESSKSYLLYKILMDERRTELAAVAAELARRIPGAAMPHPTLPAAPGGGIYRALALAEVRLIRAWIDQGANACGAAPPPPGDAGVDASTDAASDGAPPG